MRLSFLFPLLLIPVALLSQKQLDYRTCQSCEYALRWDPDGDSLATTTRSDWHPWLPEGSYGWQIVDQEQLDQMIVGDPAELAAIDPAHQLVLVFVRYDSVEWDFQVHDLRLDRKSGELQIAAELRTRTLRPQRPVISSQLIVAEVPEVLRRLGRSNLSIRLEETQIGPWDSQVSPYPTPPHALLFPIAFTQQDLLQSLRARQEALRALGGEPDLPAQAQPWVPDHIAIQGLQLRDNLQLPDINYLIIDDSVQWARLFRPLQGRKPGEQLQFTQADFDRHFAIVVVHYPPGRRIDLDRMYWVDSGLRINISVEKIPGRRGPEIYAMLIPRGDYGILSFRENGGMINAESLR